MKKIIPRKTVIEMTGLSMSTIWRLMKAGNFPLSIQLSSNRVGWNLNEVEAWIESRPRGVGGSSRNLGTLGEEGGITS